MKNYRLLITLAFSCNLLGMDLPQIPTSAHTSSIESQNRAMAIQLRAFLKDMIHLTIPNGVPLVSQLVQSHEPLVTYLVKYPDRYAAVLAATNIAPLQKLPEIAPEILQKFGT